MSCFAAFVVLLLLIIPLCIIGSYRKLVWHGKTRKSKSKKLVIERKQMAGPLKYDLPADRFIPDHNFLVKSILKHPQEKALKFCMELQQLLHEHEDPDLVKFMKEFKKNSTLHLVCVDDKFRDTTMPDPKGPLSELYDELDRDTAVSQTLSQNIDLKTQVTDCDAASDRASEYQRKQHLIAFFLLVNTTSPLSEELIMSVHGVLMKNMHRDGKNIRAGSYRREAVSAGKHNFIDYSDVPTRMKKMVKEYNETFEKEHHPFDVASRILMDTLQIHPFMDGNGRISRLLWCYSLLRDGLPFPVVPFAGLSTAYKKYIYCIEGETTNRGFMLTLTLITVTRHWKKCVVQLRQKYHKSTIIVRLKGFEDFLK